ncbi:MAG: hypothetical protein J6P89_07750 [Oscillospiraceae bacterium]|nr:hypothetical protein [Oscillospiraceae bacterium]
MHKMMMLRENLMDELEKFADKPLNDQSLEIVDKLAHAIKCIDTVSAMEQQESRESRGYSGRSYRDGGGMSGRRYRDDYSEDGMSGRRYRDGGMSGRRRRDSLGRYADGYSNDEAKDRLMSEMEGMMNNVSPEAQHAIQKALNALGQE